MEYPKQITIDDELVKFKRDWTTEERKRFERIFCAMISSGCFNDEKVSYIYKLAFCHMVMQDNFYKQTQTADHG